MEYDAKSNTARINPFSSIWVTRPFLTSNRGGCPGGGQQPNGTFFFSDPRTGLGGTSGVGLANLALGLADSYTEIGPKAFTEWRGTLFEEFIQDNWQLTHKLDLDYGLRFTTVIPYSAQWGNAVYFDPAAYNPAAAPVVNPKTGNITLGPAILITA